MRRVRIGVGLATSLALLAATAGGVPSAPTASAQVAAHALPAPEASSIIRQRLGLEGESTSASPTTPAPPRSAGPRAHLFTCNDAPGGQCGRVMVPLDRDHPGRGTVPIFFEYYQHSDSGPTNEAVVATLGGPGFSISQLFGGGVADFFRTGLLGPLLDTRDLILLDQRGVGRSQVIDCESVQHGVDDVHRDVSACGRQLGSAAYLYGSGDVALDIEAVRKALRIQKLDFYGGSYAAEDIQAYAARFPEHMRAAVLDSPTASTIGFDEFGKSDTQGLKRKVRLICARSASCEAEAENPVDSLAWLAHRLRRKPVNGVGYDADGHPHHLHVTESVLVWGMGLLSEDGPFVDASEIMAAADALRAGDPAPLLRLAAEEQGPVFGDQGNPKEFSQGEGFARWCADEPMPWDKTASVRHRLKQWKAGRNALPSDHFAPFSVRAWLAPFPTGPAGPDACINWPVQKHHVRPTIPHGAKLPGNVPALILSGDLDTGGGIILPLANAWPHSRFIEIKNSGHHTGVSFRSDCADAIIVHFIDKLRPGDASCADSLGSISYPGVGRFPLTSGGARPASVDPGGADHSTGTDRKVTTVAVAAVTDALRRVFIQSEGISGVGLRGGTFTPTFHDDHGVSVELAGARFAKDVAVSGTAHYPFDTESIGAKITVAGPGAEDGTIHVTGSWGGFFHKATVLKIRGSLGGRQLALLVPAS